MLRRIRLALTPCTCQAEVGRAMCFSGTALGVICWFKSAISISSSLSRTWMGATVGMSTFGIPPNPGKGSSSVTIAEPASCATEQVSSSRSLVPMQPAKKSSVDCLERRLGLHCFTRSRPTQLVPLGSVSQYQPLPLLGGGTVSCYLVSRYAQKLGVAPGRC